jgi:hypothetical protein
MDTPQCPRCGSALLHPDQGRLDIMADGTRYAHRCSDHIEALVALTVHLDECDRVALEQYSQAIAEENNAAVQKLASDLKSAQTVDDIVGGAPA